MDLMVIRAVDFELRLPVFEMRENLISMGKFRHTFVDVFINVDHLFSLVIGDIFKVLEVVLAFSGILVRLFLVGCDQAVHDLGLEVELWGRDIVEVEQISEKICLLGYIH